MTTVGIALFPEHEPQRCMGLARHFEDLGYSHIWVPDERFWRDLSVTMAQVIMATRKVTVGSAVTDPFVRHPALTAQMMATLDELSGGRLAVGIGAGVAGFDAMGITRQKPVVAIRESIELMRELWTGETVNYQGSTVQFHHSRLDFKPVRPRIPFYIAGRGPQVLKMAGRISEGVMIGSLASPPGLAYACGQIDAGLAAAGRSRSDLDVALWLHMAISEDGDAAREAVRTIIVGVVISSLPVLDQWGLDVPSEIRDALQGVTYGLNSPAMIRARSMINRDVIKHFAVAGTPAECREHMRQLAAAGVNHVGVVPWLVPGQTLEQFATTLAETVGVTI